MTARYSNRRKRRDAARRPWIIDFESRALSVFAGDTLVLIANPSGGLSHGQIAEAGWYDRPLGIPYITRLPNQSDEEGGFPSCNPWIDAWQRRLKK